MPTLKEIINEEIRHREYIELMEYHSHRSILSDKTYMEFKFTLEEKELLAEAHTLDLSDDTRDINDVAIDGLFPILGRSELLSLIDDTNNKIDFFVKKLYSSPLVANDNPKFHNHIKLSVDALIAYAITEKNQLKAVLYPSDKLKSLDTFTNILEATYRLLNSQISTDDYHRVASQMKGYPSDTEKKLGILMMGICAAVAAILIASGAASVIGLVTTCTIGLLGFGMFSEGKGENIGKAMYDIERQITLTN